MDPFSMLLGGAGIVSQLAGSWISYGGQQDVTKANQDQLRLEQQAEAVRLHAMEVDAGRKQMELLRSQQQANSLALVNATAGGHGRGSSGLFGGYGEIAGATADNQFGIANALKTGRDLFDINAQITQAKIRASEAGSTVAMGQGLSSLGGGISQSLGAMSRLSGFMNMAGPGTVGNTTGASYSPYYSNPGAYGWTDKA